LQILITQDKKGFLLENQLSLTRTLARPYTANKTVCSMSLA